MFALAGHVEADGCLLLLKQIVRTDLEGGKLKDSPYRVSERPSPWIKVKNRSYSQAEGREELFERGTISARVT